MASCTGNRLDRTRREVRVRHWNRLTVELLETRWLFAIESVANVHPFLGPTNDMVGEFADGPMIVAQGEDGALMQQGPGLFYFLDAPVTSAQVENWSRIQAADASDDSPPSYPDGGQPATGDIAAAAGVIPLLHSNPEATQKIYLDFDGQVVIGTDWNSQNGGRAIHAAPFDTDGDPNTYSSAELRAIERIWARVAEDYAPFDLDVTTEEPPLADFRAGKKAVRAIVTTNIDDSTMGGTGDKWFDDTGGVAYIGSWNYRSDTPVWIFENNVNNGTEKFVAEALAHEIGHALGLSHDGISGGTEYYGGHGVGETSWGSIMGASYDRNVTQWSKGEYAGANRTEDDLRIIASTINSVRYRADDHGNVIEDSTPLNVGDTNQVLGTGIISTRADVDVFSFTTDAGRIDIDVDPAPIGPNLDILVELYDVDGVLLETFEVENSLDLTIRRNLPAGQYYMVIDGTGNGDRLTDGYSDYGSLGQYTISGTVTVQVDILANSGGEYRMDEGNSLRLDASDSAGIEPLSFAWDLDADGVFDDGDQAVIDLAWSQLADFGIVDDGSYPISLRVTNAEGTIADSNTTLVIDNVNPVIESNNYPAQSTVGASNVFTIQVSDVAGTADPLEIAWDLGDGTSYQPGELFQEVSHTYQQAGTYTIKAVITDDDGGRSVLTRTIDILPFVPAIGSVVRNDGLNTYDTLSSLAFSFTADVSAKLQPHLLKLFNVSTSRLINTASALVFWDPESLTATWHLDPTEIGYGNVTAVLDAVDIRDSDGNYLDGDGDHIAGGNWQTTYIVTLPGDADLDFDVDFQDFVSLATHFGEPGTWADGDFDGDGQVDFADFVKLAPNFSKSALGD